jgi:hypothetical protein
MEATLLAALVLFLLGALVFPWIVEVFMVEESTVGAS